MNVFVTIIRRPPLRWLILPFLYGLVMLCFGGIALISKLLRWMMCSRNKEIVDHPNAVMIDDITVEKVDDLDRWVDDNDIELVEDSFGTSHELRDFLVSLAALDASWNVLRRSTQQMIPVWATPGPLPRPNLAFAVMHEADVMHFKMRWQE